MAHQVIETSNSEDIFQAIEGIHSERRCIDIDFH